MAVGPDRPLQPICVEFCGWCAAFGTFVDDVILVALIAHELTHRRLDVQRVSSCLGEPRWSHSVEAPDRATSQLLRPLPTAKMPGSWLGQSGQWEVDF